MTNHNEDAPKPPLTEPVVVPEAVCTEMTVSRTDEIIRFVGAAILPKSDGDPPERRIQVRFSMAMEAARRLWADLGTELRKRSH